MSGHLLLNWAAASLWSTCGWLWPRSPLSHVHSILNHVSSSHAWPIVLCSGKLEEYMRLLVDAFNPAAAEGLMCRDTVSVGWDGR